MHERAVLADVDPSRTKCVRASTYAAKLSSAGATCGGSAIQPPRRPGRACRRRPATRPDRGRPARPRARTAAAACGRLAEVETALDKGAETSRYTADLWTLPRVAEVIERVTGVAYHPGHFWHILREQLGWTWQRPARRAVERNDEAVMRWVKQRWPQIKEGRGASTR